MSYKGKSPSEETREKIRQALTGRRKYSPEVALQVKRASAAKVRARWRDAVLAVLGTQCPCGFVDKRALQIDHVNGGGKQERREMPNTTEFYREVIRSVSSNEGKYQLLCANCNVIKRIENKENRKQTTWH